MNRWSVYEFIKDRCMQTGRVPNRGEITRHFPGIDREELEEGVKEFRCVWVSPVESAKPIQTTRGRIV